MAVNILSDEDYTAANHRANHHLGVHDTVPERGCPACADELADDHDEGLHDHHPAAACRRCEGDAGCCPFGGDS